MRDVLMQIQISSAHLGSARVWDAGKAVVWEFRVALSACDHILWGLVSSPNSSTYNMGMCVGRFHAAWHACNRNHVQSNVTPCTDAQCLRVATRYSLRQQPRRGMVNRQSSSLHGTASPVCCKAVSMQSMQRSRSVYARRICGSIHLLVGTYAKICTLVPMLATSNFLNNLCDGELCSGESAVSDSFLTFSPWRYELTQRQDHA